MPSPEFDQAAADVQTLPKAPDNDTKLKLYATFKQATEGDVTGDRPGFADFVGRAKYDAWKKLEGTSEADAEQKYIDLVNSLLGR